LKSKKSHPSTRRSSEPLRFWREPCVVEGCDQERQAKGTGRGRHPLKCELHMSGLLERRCSRCGVGLLKRSNARTTKKSSRSFCDSCASEPARLRRHNVPLEMVLATECEVCDDTFRLAIDHDHKCCSGPHSCGKCVRGVLCQHCNQGLGNFKDDPEILKRAIAYLER
jgi:recombination endonuclease VII